jgi:hypothetical protein
MRSLLQSHRFIVRFSLVFGFLAAFMLLGWGFQMEVGAQEINPPETAEPAGGPVIADSRGVTGTWTIMYFPAIWQNYPPVSKLSVTRPNSSNAWTVSWNTVGPYVTNYELQESRSADFSSASTFNLGIASSRQFNPPLSPANQYYYRVRPNGPWGAGIWSNIGLAIAGYYDEFDNPGTGWGVRRMSYLEKTYSYYADNTLVIMVDDRWDWLVASPMVQAPSLPYAIEYRSKIHHLANLTSHGVVFGGDWNGGPCPDLANVYASSNCFNHFYATNLIWYGPIKLLFERVDYLYWCPWCEGSQLKRLTTDPASWFIRDPVPNIDSNGWNTWRVEVRADGLRMLANGQLYATSADTRWVNDPYFGLFATTDEYKPSIWFVDWFKVTPLDS